MRLVSVAVPVPAVDTLTYGVPEGLAQPVRGARVLVPLGTRVLTGVALGIPSADAEGDAGKRKNLVDILERELLGPIHGPEEIIPFSPRSQYLVGHIAPVKLAGGSRVFLASTPQSGTAPPANVPSPTFFTATST